MQCFQTLRETQTFVIIWRFLRTFCFLIWFTRFEELAVIIFV